MPTELLFVPGGGENVHDAWDDKPVESLRQHLGPAYAVRYPRMPGEADPGLAPWKAALNAKAIPQATVRRLPGRDHQLNNDLSEVAADILSLPG